MTTHDRLPAQHGHPASPVRPVGPARTEAGPHDRGRRAREAGWTAEPHPVTDPESDALLRSYYTELIVRYHGRPTDDAELDQVLAEEPSFDLARPTGEFLVARRHGAPGGCVGVRVLDAATTELKRMFVHPGARGQGVADLLVTAAEDIARDVFGALRMRLDTRGDLVEARALYARHGYAEIQSYNHNPYADHWFEKRLDAGPGR